MAVEPCRPSKGPGLGELPLGACQEPVNLLRHRVDAEYHRRRLRVAVPTGYHRRDFIDAFGRQPLAALAAERVVDGLTIGQVAEMLLPHPNGGRIRADLSSEESKRYAVAAAEVVLQAAGGFRPPD